MRLINFHICVLLVSALCLSSINAETCEETETSLVKLDLAKHSINIAKSLYPKCQDETNNSNCSVKDKSLAHLNAALDLIQEATTLCHTCPEPKIIVIHDAPRDCSDILRIGFKKSDVYQVWPRGRGVNSNESIDVFCDMVTDGGGWTVIQRRGEFPKRREFYRNWQTYKSGFGDIREEFWLGNDNIFTFTNQGNYSVRFDLVDVKREYRYATYNSFSIGNESASYVLHIDGYTGNATNDMEIHNGQKFSTTDRKNDNREGSSCAYMYHSAFWFTDSCGNVSLNGVYQPGINGKTGIWWYRWKGNHECLYSVEIKIRRTNA